MDDLTRLLYFINREIVGGDTIAKWVGWEKDGLTETQAVNGFAICFVQVHPGPKVGLFTNMMDKTACEQWFRAKKTWTMMNLSRCLKVMSAFEPVGRIGVYISDISVQDDKDKPHFLSIDVNNFLFELEQDAVAYTMQEIDLHARG